MFAKSGRVSFVTSNCLLIPSIRKASVKTRTNQQFGQEISPKNCRCSRSVGLAYRFFSYRKLGFENSNNYQKLFLQFRTVCWLEKFGYIIDIPMVQLFSVAVSDEGMWNGMSLLWMLPIRCKFMTYLSRRAIYEQLKEPLFHRQTS